MNDSGDEYFYALAGAELAKNPKQGLLVKCGTKFPNDANKAKAEYIKIRVKQLKAKLAEHLRQAAIKEEQERVAEREEQERERVRIREAQEWWEQDQQHHRNLLKAFSERVLEFESKFRIFKKLPRNPVWHWLCLYLGFALVICFLVRHYFSPSTTAVEIFITSFIFFAPGATWIFLALCPGYSRYWSNLNEIKKIRSSLEERD